MNFAREEVITIKNWIQNSEFFLIEEIHPEWIIIYAQSISKKKNVKSSLPQF